MGWTPLISTEILVLDHRTTTRSEASSPPLLNDYDLVVLVVADSITNATELYEWYKEQHPGGRSTAFVAWIPDEEDGGMDFDALLKTKNKVIRIQSNRTTRQVALLGLLKAEEKQNNSHQRGRDVGTKLATLLTAEAKHYNITSCAVIFPVSFDVNATRECVTAFLTAMYVDKRYKGQNKDDDDDDKKEENEENAIPKKLHFFQSFPESDNDNDDADNNHMEAACSAVQEATKLARGIYLTKDVVNAPHNVLNSFSLADTAQRLATESRGRLKCRILEAKECEKYGMGAFLGVSRASETCPKFIHLTYKSKNHQQQHGNKGRALTKLGIVGKGLLFDTGGYNIKTGQSMTDMKLDCGGAAAVLGAARAVAALEPEGVEVHFCIAACENMINERATVPGDVLMAMNGKTIEVLNTDAEGRLTMADALVYVDRELGCERILELSTLTGACMMALGPAMAGLWTGDEDLAAELLDTATLTGDRLWRMPLVDDYKEQIKSKIADLRNIGTARLGGAIHAALFLQNFVNADKPFAHIDMAGPAYSFSLRSATGWGTKLVTEWICRQGDNKD